MTAINIFATNNIKYRNLCQGIFKDKFYFAKTTVIENKPTETIIFSDRTYLVNYNKINKKDADWNNEILDEGFYYIQAPLDICPTWSNKSVEEFTNNKTTSINKIELYDNIRTQLEKFMDVTDDRIFDLATSYILGTYCHTLFKSYGYLFFNSDRESGKTKFMNLIELMCFNPINSTNPSESALFRICELNSPTLLVDDFEGQEDEKLRTLNQLLKVGYKKGGQVIRSERSSKENYEVRCFNVYGPKVISNTTELDPITLTRCIVVRLLKTNTNKGRLEPNEDDPIYQQIRDSCYLFVMEYWKQILETYKRYDSTKFNNRHLELVKGILSLANLIDPEIHNKIENYLEQSFLDRDTSDLTSNWDYLLFKTIYEYTSDKTEWYAVSVVSDWLKEILPEENRPKHLSNWIGKKLSKIPLFQKRRVGAGVEYLINKKLTEKYMESKGYPLDDAQTSSNTLKYKDDEIQEREEIKGICHICKEEKQLNFKSTTIIGRNYCRECVSKAHYEEIKKKLDL